MTPYSSGLTVQCKFLTDREFQATLGVLAPFFFNIGSININFKIREFLQ